MPKNIFYLTALFLCEAIQLVVLVGVGLGLWKNSPSPDALVPEDFNFWRPEHELLLYFIFLGFMVLAWIIAIRFFKHKIQDENLINSTKLFAISEAIWMVLILSALDKTVFFDYRPELARIALFWVLGLSIASKLFFDLWSNAFRAAWNGVEFLRSTSKGQRIGLILSLVLIFICIFIPNPQAPLSRMFVGEQFHHFDMSLMAPGLSAGLGHHMDVDQISQYGVGLPKLAFIASHLFGGFDYLPMFKALMWATIAYYLLFFIFCRGLLGSIPLALMVVLWGIRTQMFHPGIYPFYFTYPSTTTVRFWFDVLVFLSLWRHGQTLQSRWLWVSAFLSGMAVWYMDSTGVFLTSAFYVYVISAFFIKDLRASILKKDRYQWAALLALPVLTAFFLLLISTGGKLFSHEFWQNALETVDYFLSGIGTYPMNESFKYHNFGAGLMGFVIPLVYVLTVLIVGALIYAQRLPGRDVLIIAICCYGLGVNHYYIARSLLTSYYVTGLSFMIVCGYWLKFWFNSIEGPKTKWYAWGIALSLYALLTTHNFIAYPNLLNVSRNPITNTLVAQPLPADGTTYFYHLFRNDPANLKLTANSLGEDDEKITSEGDFKNDQQLIDFYKSDFDFTKDAQMIDHFTQSHQRVPLISSFETKILIQANREPFFYYFPLINSRPKHMRTLPLAALHTNSQRFNAKAISQLEGQKPPYVFMERVFLTDQVPEDYLKKSDQLMPIVDYVKQHYKVIETGEFLVALKRQEA